MSILTQYWPEILSGLLYTVGTSAAAAVLAIGLGMLIALLHGLPLPPLRAACRAYIDFMRGTPILIQLFLLYYAGPAFGIKLDAVTAGIVGLGANGAAYFAEIFRSGFESIPRGQIEAARLLRFSNLQIVARIKIPQMIVLILPASVNQLIILIKESSILSILTVPELTKVTTKIVNETFATTEPYIILALLFWLIVEGVSRGGRALERRIKWTF
jgi:polar amino acid transport system permease protein